MTIIIAAMLFTVSVQQAVDFKFKSMSIFHTGIKKNEVVVAGLRSVDSAVGNNQVIKRDQWKQKFSIDQNAAAFNQLPVIKSKIFVEIFAGFRVTKVLRTTSSKGEVFTVEAENDVENLSVTVDEQLQMTISRSGK